MNNNKCYKKQDEVSKKSKYIPNRNEQYIKPSDFSKMFDDVKKIYEEIDKISDGLDTKNNEITDQIYESTKNQTEQMEEVYYLTIKDLNNNIKLIENNINTKVSKSIKDNNQYILNEFKKLNDNRQDEKLKKQLDILENNITNKIENLENILKNISSATEILEGKLKQLDGISDIKELLTNIFNNQNKIDRKPTNHDEEVILNLGEYGNKIISELTDISSEYARNKEKLENINKINEENIAKIDKARSIGKEEGKISLVEEICKKIEDLDELFEEKNNESKVIVPILKNNGFLKVEGLEKGTEIEINEENRVEMESKVSFNELGNYKIIKSAFELNGNIKHKAEVEKIQ